jgi:4-hydroxythreonine-4-phosphate dehydrogenase
MKTKNTKLPIAITMGDPSGVGPEIVVKTLSNTTQNLPCVVVGDALVMKEAIRRLQYNHSLNVITRIETADYRENVINLLASSELTELPPIGEVSSKSGAAAFASIVQAIELANKGAISAIVTAPIHKEALAAAGVKYPGHTEILADYGGSNEVAMMLANEQIRTVLVTVHCSLKDAIKGADFNAQMKAIRLAHEGASALGVENPRIAVAGLNPHAGEGGLFGDEEQNIIIPAIHAAQAKGYEVSGPWPGDTVFMQARQGRFDVVVAQYHDQGLIPVKYMGVDQGVNITLGLPFIRTSPDHGTAFDIAGKNIADHKSLETALHYATQLVTSHAKEVH